MAVDLSVNIGANVNEAVKGLGLVAERAKHLQDGIAVLRAKLADTKSEKFYAFALDNIAKKQAELNKIQRSTGEALNKTSVNSAKATQSLTDLSRIAQDAPYGFNAIANNLNPLVESFGRLKTATGSTGGALRALLGTLSGPAGIGIAVAVASSLFVKFGDSLFGTSKKTKETADATDELALQQKILKGEILSTAEAEKVQTNQLQQQATQLKKLNELIASSGKSYSQRRSEAQGSVQEEITLVTSLASVVQNQSLSYEQRNNALNQLKSINQGYFGDLKLEANSLATLTAKVQQYTNALVAQEVVKGYTKDIADLTIANNGASRSLDALKTQQNQLNEQLRKTPQFTSTLRGNVGYVKEQNKEWATLTGQLADVNSQISAQELAIKKGANAAQNLTKDLNGAVIEASKFKSPEIKAPKTTKEDDVVARAKRIAAELEKIGAIVPDFSALQKKDQQTKIAQAFIKQFENVKIKFKVEVDQNAIDVPPIAGEQYLTEAEKQAEKDGAILGQSFIDGRNKVLTTGFILTPEALKLRNLEAAFEQNKKLGEDLAKSFNQAFAVALQSGFESIGEGIGNILSGKDFGKGILQVFSGLLQAIGQALIQFGIVKKGLDAILGPSGIAIPGATAIGLGILAIASAQLVKNFGGAREKGGPVSGNKSYLVGERGPELFVPSVSGSIVPNNRLSSFSGRPAFASGSGGGRTIVRGNDILLASARTQRSQNRVNA
jgi:hypothetical protein